MGAAFAENTGASKLSNGFGPPSFDLARGVREGGYKLSKWPAPSTPRPSPQARESGDAERTRRRHFHLLSDQDLDDLRPIVEAVLQRHGEIIRDWYRQYVIHLADSGTFSQDQFERIFGDGIRDSQSSLIGGDIEKYAAGISRLGGLVAEFRMPLDELIACFQLFKSIVCGSIDRRRTPLAAAFDRLSYVQLLLLTGAYLGGEGTTGEEDPALRGEAAYLPASNKSSFQGLIGASAAMRRLYRRIEAAAATTGNLLLVGESGTGKELVARAVHQCSARAGRPFVALNCAALPKDLIESELFGYKRGAFSGAGSEYAGLFRAADGGTLFLDEITEMSAETQSKLLRAIQERAIRPLGSTVEQPVDVRLIASTNRDLRAAVAVGRLREDLYYRMQAAVLTVPPLRERREDIPLLVEHFMRLFNRTLGRTMEGIEPGALDSLTEYDWPGNVRELSNALEGAFTFGGGRLIGVEDLPHVITGCADGQFELEHGYFAGCTDPPVTTFADTERDLVARALQSSGGNKVRAAEQLKISRKKLYAKIAKYSLSG